MRDKYGSGKEEDDKVVSWSLSKADLDPTQVSDLDKTRAAIVGDKEHLRDGPPTVDDAGNLVGGSNFERGFRAVYLTTGRRCYPVSITHQVPKRLDAPARSNKVFTPSLDDEAKIRFDLLKAGATSSIAGLKKGPPGLLEALTVQSELVNLPRVGTDANVIYTSYQLNVASPQDPNAANATGIDALGHFGGVHIDAGDSSVPPTAMTVLTEPHEDVEDEYFHLIDLGLSWRLEEYSTLYFSGLHFHGGSQPLYKTPRSNPSTPGLRLTLIGYAGGDGTDGKNAIALGSDEAGQLVTLPIESRNPKTAYVLGQHAVCTQATFLTDGLSIFEATSQLRFLSRSMLLWAFRFVSQVHPALLTRIDREKFLSSFSCVVNNRRIAASDWELGPGWTGEDVQLSELPPSTLARLWNSNDVQTTDFFNNGAINNAIVAWDGHSSRSEANIPICVVVAEDHPLGGRSKGKRRGAIQAARREPSKSKKRPPPADSEKSSRASKKPKEKKNEPLVVEKSPPASEKAKGSAPEPVAVEEESGGGAEGESEESRFREHCRGV
ncbi:hypothetical protein NLJ89_g7946 [Agrocybe chaxingu]|uniref:Uncharacterized protein n=1 Tax=Agrocybe chaxingu TaxID=84603 RepID=A0A9W8K2P0_9AGAR|nr:hypothetical protein NLJ89_g7946 [Agrocybe chaxingu]